VISMKNDREVHFRQTVRSATPDSICPTQA
jgi:hypothetical protein